MATATDGTSVDDGKFEPAAFVQKNLHIEGVQLLYDEITSRKSANLSRSSSTESSPQVLNLLSSQFTTHKKNVYDFF